MVVGRSLNQPSLNPTKLPGQFLTEKKWPLSHHWFFFHRGLSDFGKKVFIIILQ